MIQSGKRCFKSFIYGFFLLLYLVSLAHDPAVSLFVAMPTTVCKYTKTLNDAIKREIEPNYKAYPPHECHFTLFTLGQIAANDLPKVYQALKSYIAHLDKDKALMLVSKLTIASTAALDLFSSPYNKFFVIKLSGVTDQEIHSLLLQPLRQALDNAGVATRDRDGNPILFVNKPLFKSPHISLGKVKTTVLSPQEVTEKLQTLTHLLPAPGIQVITPTIMLYKGIPGGIQALKEYPLEPEGAVEHPDANTARSNAAIVELYKKSPRKKFIPYRKQFKCSPSYFVENLEQERRAL